jgi:hypothetical protein
MLRRLSLPAAVAAAALLLAGPAPPGMAQTTDAQSPETVVASFESALDAHDGARAAQLLSDSTTLLGMDTANGQKEVQAWVQDQIDHNVVIEVGPLHVNGGRVTWTARVSRTDWTRDGIGFKYVDEEAAVTAGQITVIGQHARPPNQPPTNASTFVRARTLAFATQAAASTRPSNWLGLVALVVSGVFAGLYVAGGWEPRSTGAASLQKGRLVPALARSVESRRSRED